MCVCVTVYLLGGVGGGGFQRKVRLREKEMGEEEKEEEGEL